MLAYRNSVQVNLNKDNDANKMVFSDPYISVTVHD